MGAYAREAPHRDRDLADRRPLRPLLRVGRWFAPAFVVVILITPISSIESPTRPTHFTTSSSVIPSAPPITDNPYALPATLFPQPDNLTGLARAGNFTSLSMASGVLGGMPTLFVVYGAKNTSSTYSVMFRSGSYNVTNAWQLDTLGTCSPGSICHHPIRWANTTVLTTSSSPIQGTALAYNSGALVLAYATAGSTYFSEATDGGGKWLAITHINGTNPVAATAGGDVEFTVRQGSSSEIERFAVNCGSPTGIGPVPLTLNGTPVVAASGAEGELVSSSTNHSVLYYPVSGGTSLLAGEKIGGVAPNSTSPIFNAIGGTLLATAPAYPGQLAATSINNTLFGVYTTSVGGRTVAATTISGNGGVQWSSSDFGSSSLGSIEGPVAIASPQGLVYASWMSNSNGTWQLEQSIYSTDGRLRVGPNPVPGSGGTPGRFVVAFAATVTPVGTPYYAWIANVSGSAQILFSGADLTPAAAASLLNRESLATAPLDYVSGSAANKATLISNDGLLQTDILTVQYANAATLAEGTLYGELTNGRLILLCAPATDTQPACKAIHSTSGQLLTQTAGVFSAPAVLGWYLNLTLMALGVGVSYPDLTPHVLLAGAAGTCGSQQFDRISLSNPPPPPSGPTPTWLLTWSQNSSNGASDSVFSHVINPKAANLSITYSFPTTSSTWSRNTGGVGGSAITVCNVTAPTTYQVVVKVGTSYNSGPTGTFSGSGRGTTVYLVNLTAGGLVYWEVTAKATMRTTQYTSSGSIGNCPAGSTSSVLGTSTFTLSGAAGYLNTSMLLLGAHVNASATPGSRQLLISWNNSMPAKSWFNASGNLSSGSNSAFVTAESFVENPVWGGSYSLAASSGSKSGGVPANSRPNVSENIAPTTSPAQWGSWSQPISGFTPGLLQLSNLSVTNVTTTNATVTWQTNHRSNGTVTLYDNGPNTTTLTSQITSESLSGGVWTTHLALHGLEEFSNYSVRALGNLTSGGITYNALSLWVSFNTPSNFAITAYDQPYDSISQQGGGTSLAFSLPQSIIQKYPFHNGTIVYLQTGNSSSTTIVPLQRLDLLTGWTEIPQGGYLLPPTSYEENLSLPLVNANYTITVELNFTLSASVYLHASSFAYSFMHLKDTTGDGLADSEKVDGWSVTTQTETGAWNPPNHVWANPTQFASNGLTNDFIEKEFGLNPGTVDSAASHTLDTWNLTFDLGKVVNNPLAPAGGNLRYWYANTSLHPFSSCQYPGQPGSPSCSGFIKGTNLTNLTQTGDNSPWASEVLWDRSQLSVFYNLTGVKAASWLRAVYGSYGALRTLTIWGKLSWGANPLATSTPQDGISDGSRVNPLYDEDLQLNFVGYGVDACGNIPANAGAALQLHILGAVGGYAGNNYTKPINLSGCPSGNGGTQYELTLPVDNTVQTEIVKIGFVGNVSTNSTPRPQLLPVSACKWNYNVSIGMLNATPETNGTGAGSIIVHGNPTGTCAGASNVTTHISFGASEVPAGLKVPTYLWIPNDNSTLTSQPWGLKRYAGEQSFDMVVIDDTDGGSHVRSDLVPTPWGGPGYYVSALTGMIELLIPRGQFLNSTFGESILLNRSLPSSHAPGGGPLLASNQSGAVANSTHAATLSDLSCYWQNRAVWHQPWLCSGGQTGTPSNHSGTLSVVDTSSCSGSNCGGVPWNAGLENASAAGPALQFVASFNLSSSLGSTRAELDAILAAVLDNSTHGGTGSFGLNGTFVNVTTEISTLALAPAVVGSMVNAVLPSGGNYGVPVSRAVAPQKPSGAGVLGLLVNTASGILYSVQTGSWLGAAWSTLTASLDFQVFLAVEMAKVVLAIANRTAQGLTIVGAALASAARAFASWLLQQVSSALSGITSALRNGIVAEARSLGAAVNSTLLNGSASPLTAYLWTTALMPIIILATAVATGLSIAAGVLTPAAAIFGPLAQIIVLVLLTILTSRVLSAVLPGVSGSGSYLTLMSEVNTTSQAEVATSNPSCSPNPAVVGGIFAITSFLAVMTTSLSALVQRELQDSPQSIFFSAMMSSISLVLATIVAVSLGTIAGLTYDALLGTSIVVGIIALVSDVITSVDVVSDPLPGLIVVVGIINAEDVASLGLDLTSAVSAPC